MKLKNHDGTPIEFALRTYNSHFAKFLRSKGAK